VNERIAAVAFAVAERHLRKLVSSPALFIPPLVFPLFFFTAFAGGLSAVGNVPDFGYPDYTGFQYVFVLVQTAAFGGVFTGFSMAADWSSGFARRMMLAAPHRFGIALGYVGAALVRTVVIVAFVTVVALIAGMQATASTWSGSMPSRRSSTSSRRCSRRASRCASGRCRRRR
jgi:ABC-2 type transport system permease protein